MKKLLALMLLILLLFGTAFAECGPIWDRVAGHSFIYQDYILAFSEAYAGPCPQGRVKLFKNGELLGVFPYRAKSDDLIIVNNEFTFILECNSLIYVSIILRAEPYAEND